MALAVETVNGGSEGTNAGSVASASLTVTSANLMLVAITVGDNTLTVPLSAITWSVGTQSLTAVASSIATDSNFTSVKWFRLDNPNAGTGTVNVTFSENLQQAAVHVVTFTGASLTLKTPSITNGTSANPSLTVVDTATDDIVVAALCSDSAADPLGTANSLIFEAEDLEVDTDHGSQYKVATGASTVMAWTNIDSGSGWCASGLAVQASAGGGVNNAIAWVRG